MKKCIVFILAITGCLVVEADVISWLRFEENGGGTAFDEIGLLVGQLVSFSAAQMAPGGGDSAGRGWSSDVPLNLLPLTGDSNTTSMRMNGGSAYIDLSNFNTLSLGTEFTIEFFMKPDDNAEQFGGQLFGFGGDFTDIITLSVSISLGQPYFTSQFMDEQDFFLAEEIQFNEWQHVALVKELGGYSIYLNGQLLANPTLSAGTDGPYDFFGDPTLGTRLVGTWRGWLDEFRISDEALTPSQFLIAVPEPSSLILFGLGLFCLFRKRK